MILLQYITITLRHRPTRSGCLCWLNSFGKFSPETNGGEIHLSPQGMRSVNGSVVLSGGGHSNGSFIITGEDQATFSISLPSGQHTHQ